MKKKITHRTASAQHTRQNMNVTVIPDDQSVGIIPYTHSHADTDRLIKGDARE